MRRTLAYAAMTMYEAYRRIRTFYEAVRKGRKDLEVKVFDNDVEKALKILKNKLSKSGLFKELKLRRAYEKPSVKKKRKTIEARRRLAKTLRRKVS
jgi:small subunit ribosomal protein S21